MSLVLSNMKRAKAASRKSAAFRNQYFDRLMIMTGDGILGWNNSNIISRLLCTSVWLVFSLGLGKFVCASHKINKATMQKLTSSKQCIAYCLSSAHYYHFKDKFKNVLFRIAAYLSDHALSRMTAKKTFLTVVVMLFNCSLNFYLTFPMVSCGNCCLSVTGSAATKATND